MGSKWRTVNVLWPFQWWSRHYNSGDYGSGDNFAFVFFFFHISKTREVDVYLKRSIMYTGMND